MSDAPLNLRVNGQDLRFEGCALEALLRQQTQPTQSFAVAINGVFVPRSAYSSTTLAEGDQIEILIPMQGG